MIQRLKFLLPAVMAIGLTVSGSRTASAGLIVVDSSDAGWYDIGGSHSATNTNYIAGSLNGNTYRNFFVFDLSGVTEQIIGAELRLFNPGAPDPGFTGPPATYSVHAVSTPVTTLVTSHNNNAEGQAIFADLGDGTQFGSRAMSILDNGSIVSIDLSGALAALNSASGGLFAAGGMLAFTPTANNYAFAFTNTGNETRQLVLTTVPEPVSVAQIIVGLVGIGIWRHKRRSDRS
jgi:hypothetical protein